LHCLRGWSLPFFGSFFIVFFLPRLFLLSPPWDPLLEPKLPFSLILFSLPLLWITPPFFLQSLFFEESSSLSPYWGRWTFAPFWKVFFFFHLLTLIFSSRFFLCSRTSSLNRFSESLFVRVSFPPLLARPPPHSFFGVITASVPF